MKPHPTAIKVLTLLAIIVMLMIALARVGDLAEERQQRAAEARQGIEQAQAGAQTLLGPMLRTVCHETWEETLRSRGTPVTTTRKREFTIHSTPDHLEVTGGVTMEPRHRGLFKVNTYVADTTLAARWTLLRPEPENAGGKVSCEAPVLAVAVSDPRGLREAQVKVGGQVAAVQPGTPFAKLGSGFHAVMPAAVLTSKEPLAVDIRVQLVGTGDLAIAPVGDTTRVDLTSDWPHPSFGGRFLPVQRELRDDGFHAVWQVTSLASSAGRDALSGAGLCDGPATSGPCVETFSVAFVDPVNPYTLTDRALKYGLLFIALSFVAVGMVEVLQRLRVHPVQYLLVGCALAIFFLLLLSLSEHLAFGWSYTIASAACVTLLGFYARHILGGWPAGLGFGAGIAALYGALFVLLQMEQTAMVLGAVLLFVVLAAVMIATRRIDWYGLTRSTAAAS